jgi:transcriptional regulator with XRE-family HTH domain
MTLGEKIRYLREVEGTLRGLGREMTQNELSRAIRKELGQSISQSYISQIESGARPHLTASTRSMLARFFKVHPGYLVDDPPGYHHELTSDVKHLEAGMDVWLMQGAGRFEHDRELSEALMTLAGRPDSRRCILLLAEVMRTPHLAERLMNVLGLNEPRPGDATATDRELSSGAGEGEVAP